VTVDDIKIPAITIVRLKFADIAFSFLLSPFQA